ncbi:MAG TPA: rhodanese [Alphaproteobacteria bacterium]|nr:rhodanese [Alphaproteobacteria bacterium]HAM48624.1 rhodanese [Alphaproteobacteria bacterium]HBA41444.1 rhodanese [Alphaproteobacteria bacterium]
MAIKSVYDMCKQAEQVIETLSAEQVVALKDDPNVEIVDIRDIREIWRDGGVPNAYHVPRGMLEFWIDPNGPYPKERFQSGKKFIFMCAGGLRSALAGLAAHNMGLAPVAHMAGGFAAWKKAGGPVEEVKPKE